MAGKKLDEITSATGVRRLVRRARSASLATLSSDGAPYASLVNVACDHAGRPLILISRLAWHTRNLLHDGRASLLVAESRPAGDPLEAARATLIGQFEQVSEEGVARRYLALHPDAADYAGFADFSYWRLDAETIHVVAGFGRIRTFAAADMLIEPKIAVLFGGIETSAVEHMNSDHDDAVALYWQASGGKSSPTVQAVAIDPEGIDLADGAEHRRFEFGRVLKDGAELRHELAAHARRLRARR